LTARPRLPDTVQVFERGWLSANNVLLFDGGEATLVDSGYVTHAGQTVALVGAAPADQHPLAFRSHRR
jgi:glyoxylase-like metal-dependent hydrolase (beta-lactamase superfamily II)